MCCPFRRVSAYPDENTAARRYLIFAKLVTNGAASRVFAARSPSAATRHPLGLLGLNLSEAAVLHFSGFELLTGLWSCGVMAELGHSTRQIRPLARDTAALACQPKGRFCLRGQPFI